MYIKVCFTIVFQRISVLQEKLEHIPMVLERKFAFNSLFHLLRPKGEDGIFTQIFKCKNILVEL